VHVRHLLLLPLLPLLPLLLLQLLLLLLLPLKQKEGLLGLAPRHLQGQRWHGIAGGRCTYIIIKHASHTHRGPQQWPRHVPVLTRIPPSNTPDPACHEWHPASCRSVVVIQRTSYHGLPHV
jgi:hypothetical protein